MNTFKYFEHIQIFLNTLNHFQKHSISFVHTPYILFMAKSENLINKIAYLTIDRHICAHPKYIEGLQNMYTGGPRISWFLVPKGNHEMRGSWIPRTVFSVKPQNGSKSFLKSTFWAFFSWNFNFSPIEIAAFSSLLFHAY